MKKLFVIQDTSTSYRYKKLVTVNTPFTTKTRKKQALLYSIRKWEFILTYLKEDPNGISYFTEGGCDTCALCCRTSMELDRTDKRECSGCPIQEYTHLGLCRATPYSKATHELSWSQDFNKTKIPAVRKEVNFLKRVYRKFYGELK